MMFTRANPQRRALLCILISLLSGLPGPSPAAVYEPSSIQPPRPPREFRGAWIATVANIDWPSRSNLSTAEQKAELITLLDRAAQLRLNAIVFQVRPACDAFYASPYEPWSEYLTGVMGRAPSPYYDPLAFAIEEAHRRGLELHAWFNPYRALHRSHSGPVATNHVSRTHPHLVKRWGDYLWLDPGERDVQDYTLRAILDVVRRYDLDGVQIDDYFYPERDGTSRTTSFPDDASWRKYGVPSRMNRDDWRRDNVNSFVERIYNSIKSSKPWVKFGVSPRGIWRPGHPPQIRGSDDYAEHFADSRKWLMNGWLDYFSPQLYWRIQQTNQSFPVLLDWWAEQNVKGRHLWPGLSTAYAVSQSWAPEEIPNQIQITRNRRGSTGYIFYNMKHLVTNAPLMTTLQTSLHRETALVPASPWLNHLLPPPPAVSITNNAAGGIRVTATLPLQAQSPLWVLQTRTGETWNTEIIPGRSLNRVLGIAPDVIAVTRVDRFGNASHPIVRAKKVTVPTGKPPRVRPKLESPKTR